MDLAESRNESFTIQNCIHVALDHWAKVRETELTIGPKQNNGGGTKTTTEPPSDSTQPKKRRRKNKKSKDTKQDSDGIAAAATKDKAPPPATPKDPQKPPTPQYCFRCGEEDHMVKACKEQGDLRCETIWTRTHTRPRLVACGGRPKINSCIHGC